MNRRLPFNVGLRRRLSDPAGPGARLGAVANLALLLAVLAFAPLAAAAEDSEGAFLDELTGRLAGSLAHITFLLDMEEGAQEMFAGGIVVSPDGLVLMNAGFIPNHIAADRLRNFAVSLPELGEKSWEAEFLGKDEQARVALLKVTDKEAPVFSHVRFRPDKTLRRGDPAITVGSLTKTFNLRAQFETGRVSAVLDSPMPLYYLTGTLRIAPGSLLCDSSGDPVGLVDMTGETAIPASVFQRLIDSPPSAREEEKTAWLGISGMQSVSRALADRLGIESAGGILVGSIIAGTPAEKAGLRVKDVVLKVDGLPIRREIQSQNVIDAFVQAIKEKRIGQTAVLEIWRDGKGLSVPVELGETPKTERHAERFRDKAFGLTVRELVFSDLYFQALPLDQPGVVVEYSQRAGWARDGGLFEGDIVLKFNGREIAGVAAFKAAMESAAAEKPRVVVAQILRGGVETLTLRIEPDWDEHEKIIRENGAENR